jgi:hypothetical protein
VFFCTVEEQPGHQYRKAEGLLPLPSHLAAVEDFLWSETVKKMQAFLKMADFTTVSCLPMHKLSDS